MHFATFLQLADGHDVEGAIWVQQATAIGLAGRLPVSVQQMYLNTFDLPQPP